MRRLVAVLALFAVLVAACAQASPPAASSEGTLASAPSSAGPVASPSGELAIPLCSSLQPITAPPEAYRDAPIYVANEMPSEAVQAWARGKPGFEELWLDREHNGWITVAFSEGAAERQRELESAFPGVGVVAVQVPWRKAALEALQHRVVQELAPTMESLTVGSGGRYGFVSIGIGVLTPERIAEVERRFAGERVCIDGEDPANLPPPGPQALEGDGWRLIGNEQTGHAYRTGIAWDAGSLRLLWQEAGLSGDPPAVDFTKDVVIWFGAVYGSSCPNIRLDAVGTNHLRRFVHAEIVQVDAPAVCTADANPRAFVVTYERSRLPMAPFKVQLGAGDPAGGDPDERTVVEADLRVPGSVAAPGQVHGDAGPPPQGYVEPGGFIEPDFEWQFRLPVHCGVEWLGPLNDVTWRTEVPAAGTAFIPAEWEPVVADERIVLTVLMRTGDEPTLTATANGHTITYRATADDPPACR